VSQSLRSALLVVHVATGSAALLLAVPLVTGRLRWAGRAGLGFGTAVVMSGATAILLLGAGSSMPTPARLVLLAIAVATSVAATVGLRRARRGVAGSRRLLHGSVVSLVTAVAVVSGPPALWLAVGVTGTLWVELGQRRLGRALAGH